MAYFGVWPTRRDGLKMGARFSLWAAMPSLSFSLWKPSQCDAFRCIAGASEMLESLSA